MSTRTQRILVWWSIAFMVIYGVVLWTMVRMVPPPRATLSASQIADFYTRHHTSIRVGAVIASYTSAFMVPISVVVGVQLARIERGRMVWAILSISGGIMMSIFLVLPPLFWGVAAFSPHRAVESTALMHELSMLTLTTTDQYYIFMWVAIAVICFRKTSIPFSPFPRWFGYFTIWTALMFEAGAIAFMPRTGPFAWNGLLVFWSPLTLFGAWLAVTCVLQLKAIRQQRDAGEDADELPYAMPAVAAAR
jgi:hypothetical protein